MGKNTFSPVCLFCCWHLHIHCKKNLNILRFWNALYCTSSHAGELAVVVMCGTAVLCVQLPWYGLSHLTWQSQANVFTPWNDFPHPTACVSQLCLLSFPLIILCSFEIINMQGWRGLYSEFRQLALCLLVYWNIFSIICLVAVKLSHKIKSAAMKWCFRCSGWSSLVRIHLTSDLKKLHIFSLFIWNPLREREQNEIP